MQCPNGVVRQWIDLIVGAQMPQYPTFRIGQKHTFGHGAERVAAIGR